jgi:large subunit ribosomal protein L1
MKIGKRIQNIHKNIDINKEYNIKEALQLVKDNAKAKFDESIDVVFKLNLDPKYQDQNIREVVQMPEGLGKSVTVAVIANTAKHEEAKKSGADFIGSEDLVEEIKKGKTDFDICIATPDMMVKVGQLGKILGPKGLMPNPKLGTVTQDVGKAVSNAKKGQVEIKLDKAGIMHTIIGKASFNIDKLNNNFQALYTAIKAAKPSGAKGSYIKNLYIGSTQGLSIEVSLSSLT